jgi:hypothetical protein
MAKRIFDRYLENRRKVCRSKLRWLEHVENDL